MGADKREYAPFTIDDTGSAARFFQHCPPDADAGDAEIVRRAFYSAKASKSERDAGCEALAERDGGHFAQDEWSRQNMGNTPDAKRAPVRNHHPTVKPLALTEYLARLILPPPRDTPRRLLIPFSGSGSEIIGALRAGWDEVVGIELDADYCAIGVARIKYWQAVIAEERAAPQQAGLF